MLATLPLLLALANAPTAAAPVQDPAQQVARRAVQQGRYVPLESVVRDALKRYPGQLLEVELDDGVYEVEILRGDGVVVVSQAAEPAPTARYWAPLKPVSPEPVSAWVSSAETSSA